MTQLEHPGKTEKQESIGTRLRLREVRLSDANGPYLEWMNDAEVLDIPRVGFNRTLKRIYVITW